MAAASESQGLKIAVAIFATLAFILGVTTYFGFSSFGDAQAKYEDAEKKLREKDSLANKLQNEYNQLRQAVGGNEYAAKESQAEVDALVKRDKEALAKKLNESNAKIQDIVNQLKQAGVGGAKLDELSQAGNNLVTRFTNNPNNSLVAALDTLTDLTGNQAVMATEIAKDYIDTRRVLENTDQVNKQQLDVELAENQKIKEDLAKEHETYEAQRSGLMTKFDQLQSDNANQAQEIAKLNNQIAQLTEEFTKQRDDLARELRRVREEAEKKETVLDRKDGTVTFVDNERGEIRSRDITRNKGAREQMIFSVFDKNAPGLPTDKPKGTIQLIQVLDSGSLAKILKINDPLNPIRPGDQIYSPAWSPDSPKTFALIGKIDVDRDGRDDRGELKRLIEAAGGKVVYDLPPPGLGSESGEMRALTSYYVIDERQPLRPDYSRSAERKTTEEEEAFMKKRTETLRKAWVLGIRPITIESLLTYLGYTYDLGFKDKGKVEAIDMKTINEILNPGGAKGVLPGSEDAQPAPDQPAPDTDVEAIPGR
jgi:peptidoglycan hydrolase CwlO-like protein